jgi:hypothetical protein
MLSPDAAALGTEAIAILFGALTGSTVPLAILAAGATRGVSFGSATPVLRPPLDADFFAQLRASELAEDKDALARSLPLYAS